MTHVNKEHYFCRNKKLTIKVQWNCNYMNHLRLLLTFFTMAVILQRLIGQNHLFTTRRTVTPSEEKRRRK